MSSEPMIEHQVKILLVVVNLIAIGGSLSPYKDYDPLDMLSFYDSYEEYDYTDKFPETNIRPYYDATEQFFQRRYIDEMVKHYYGVHPHFKKNMLAFMSAIFKLGDAMELGRLTKEMKDYLREESLRRPEHTGADLMKRFKKVIRFFKTMGRVYEICEMRRQSIESCDKNSTNILKGWNMETVPLIIQMSGSFAKEYVIMEPELVLAANRDTLDTFLERHVADVAGLAASASQLNVVIEERSFKLMKLRLLSLTKKKVKNETMPSKHLKGEKKRQKRKRVVNPYSTLDLYEYEPVTRG